MRRVVGSTAIAVASLIAGMAVAGDNYFLLRRDTGSLDLIDFDSVTLELNNGRTATTTIVWPSPRPFGTKFVNEVQIDNLYDCKKQTIKSTVVRYYTIEDELVKTSIRDGIVLAALPGSIGEVQLHLVCDGSPPQIPAQSLSSWKHEYFEAVWAHDLPEAKR